MMKASKKAFHVRQNISQWAVRSSGNASRAPGDAAVQWMGDDGDLDASARERVDPHVVEALVLGC